MHKYLVAHPTKYSVAYLLIAREYGEDQVSVYTDRTGIDVQIAQLSPGDVFVAELHQMLQPYNLDDFAESLKLIGWLTEIMPEGTHAYLIDLAGIHTDRNVLRAIQESKGRIYLQAGPVTVNQLIPQLERWQKEEEGQHAKHESP